MFINNYDKINNVCNKNVYFLIVITNKFDFY